MDALPGQADAEISGLDAKLQGANANILAGARRRGLGFSGIPVAEQAQYAASEYAPAVARAREGARTQAMSLQEALLGLGREQRTQAEGIFNSEQQRDLAERQLAEQVRQFNENLALQREQMAAQERASRASAGGGVSFGGGGGGGGGSQPSQAAGKAPSYGFKNGKNGSSGFWFTDQNGRAISAAKYAQLTGTNVAQLVTRMANAGDAAARALVKGPGIKTSNLTYRKQFAWDL